MATTTNDDALVDCIVYANEVRIGQAQENVVGTRAISDPLPPPHDLACSISMCGNDEECDSPCRLLRYCPNGHCMHDRCVEYLYMAAETLSVVVCPQCRSEHPMKLVLEANPIHPRLMCLLWGDKSVVRHAVKTTVPHVDGAYILPFLLDKMDHTK
jgi:hypothetical protein